MRQSSPLRLWLLLLLVAFLCGIAFLPSGSANDGAVGPTRVSSWSAADVAAWLLSLESPPPQSVSEDSAAAASSPFAGYAAAALAEHVDGEALLELSDEDWRRELGVAPLGHRKKIAKALRQLREAEEAQATTANSAADARPEAREAAMPSAASTTAELPPQQPTSSPKPVSEAPKGQPAAAAKVDAPYVAAPQTRQPGAATALTKKPSRTKSKTPPQKAASKRSNTAGTSGADAAASASKAGVGGSGGFVSALSAEAQESLLEWVRTAPVPAVRQLSPSEEQQVALLLREALAAHQRGDMPAAETLYRRVLALQPAQGRALHNLGLVLMSLGPQSSDYEAALAHLRASLAVAPDAECFVNLGSLHWQQHQQQQLRQQSHHPQRGGSDGTSHSALALTAWKRALDLSPLAGGPALRVRYGEALYDEALRLHERGEHELCRQHLQAVVVSSAEAVYFHFPADYVPPMSARMLEQYESNHSDGAGNGREQDARDARLSSFLSASPQQLMATNAATTHALRTLLADAWLHLGMLAESAPGATASNAVRSRAAALALAYFDRASSVVPDALDAQAPPAMRVQTIVSEAQQAAARIRKQSRSLSAAQRKVFHTQAAQQRDWVLRHQLDPFAGDAVPPSASQKAQARSRRKKIVDHLAKSCQPDAALELARLGAADDGVFQSPRFGFLYSDETEMHRTRLDFDALLDALLDDPSMAGVWADGRGLEWNRFRFYTAYHGVNNRALMEKLATVYRRAAPVLDYTAPHLLADPTNGLGSRLEALKKHSVASVGAGQAPKTSSGEDTRIRVGFISAFLSQHPVGKTLQGYIALLPRSRFRVFVYFFTLQPEVDLSGSSDPVLSRIRDAAERFTPLEPEQWPAARAVLADDQPDVLIFGDLGMEATSYFLAFGRLAPVQALTFGHPDTSGLPETIDYFLSHEHMELPDPVEAQSYYSERLVRLPGAGFFYPAVLPPMDAQRQMDRAYFGISDRDLQEAGVEFPEGAAGVSAGAAAAAAADARSSLRSDSAHPMFLVTKSVQFFSPGFVDALASILASVPSAFLVLVMDTGKLSKGYDMHNACITRIYEGIERRLRRKQHMLRRSEAVDHGDDVEREEEMDSQPHARAERQRRQVTVTRDGPPYENDVLGALLSLPSAAAAPASGVGAAAGVSGRVRFVDKGDQVYFMSLLRVADVLLQPFPLDGTTTTLEAVTASLPTVMRRSRTLGGRMASALYSHANFTETVAESDEEYVRIAVRLATEPAFHAHVREQLQQIVQQPGRLFEDTRAIDAYAAWIDQAVTEVAAGANTKGARHDHDEL